MGENLKLSFIIHLVKIETNLSILFPKWSLKIFNSAVPINIHIGTFVYTCTVQYKECFNLEIIWAKNINLQFTYICLYIFMAIILKMHVGLDAKNWYH